MNSGFNGAVANVVEKNRHGNNGVLNPCHQCQNGNRDDAKFCQSCGTPLFQACPSCQSASRIGQTFCGGCGFNLIADAQQKLSAVQTKLIEAKQALLDFDFDRASELLRSIRSLNEDRSMAEVIRQAEVLSGQLVDERARWEEKLKTASKQATEAAQRLEHEQVITTVDSLPDRLVSDELRKLRQRSKQLLDEQQELLKLLKAAVKSKDYVNVGYRVESLLSLKPGDAELQTLSTQVSGVLIKAAMGYLNESHYADAFASLAAIPSAHRGSEEYQKLKDSIDDAVWITDQIARSPFATKQLGLMAKRLGMMAPSDVRITKVVQEIAAKLKTGSSDPLSLYPRWNGPSKGWGDVEVTIAGPTKRIVWGSQSELVRNPTRYMVAIGLALHAIGETKFEGYAVQTKGLSSLISRFSKKSPTAAWGIDLGASAVRAIKLERQGDRIKIADVIWLPFDSSASRTRNLESSKQSSESHLTDDKIVKLKEVAERTGKDGVPIWGNVPSRDSLGRFFPMPPLADKKLASLLEHELATQFPLPADQLSAASAVTGLEKGGSPRGTIVACKKSNVEKRETTFIDAGIKLSGLMPDPVALHHYVGYEWNELIASDESSTKTKAIAVVDSGSTGSTLYVGTATGFWFRHHGFGGDDLTAAVASICNMTHQQAEAARIESAKLTSLALAMEAIDRRIDTFAFRISQSASMALQSFENAEFGHIFCTGGTSLHHGWTRRAIAPQLTSS